MKEYRCIVVEDQALVRNSLIRKVKQLDMGVRVIDYADNGNLAVQKIEQLLPDFVITDIRIPGMDGVELMQWLNFTYPSVPFIVTSGYAEFQYAQAAVRYHAVDYLLKPVTPDALREGISKAILQCSRNEDSLDNLAHPDHPQALASVMKEYILQHFRENFTLENIAESSGYSPAYLSRIFRKSLSQTPLQFLISLRINEAKRLLIAEPGMSVAAIGCAVGYDDAYYFSRLFRKYTGMYPSDFRENAEQKKTDETAS